VRRDAAYYIAFYGYYLRRGVAPGGFLHANVRYAVRLVDDAMGNAIAELSTDGVLVRQEAVSADFR